MICKLQMGYCKTANALTNLYKLFFCRGICFGIYTFKTRRRLWNEQRTKNPGNEMLHVITSAIDNNQNTIK